MEMKLAPTGDQKLMQEHFEAQARDLVAEHLQEVLERYAARGRRLTKYFIEGNANGA